MSAERKITEGRECIRLAEKYLKTSLLKWKPDFDSAAAEYSKAATCFRTAKALDQCKECLMKAAECYSQNHSQQMVGHVMSAIHSKSAVPDLDFNQSQASSTTLAAIHTDPEPTLRFFSAAKSFEQAAFVCKEMDDYAGAARMVERACELFREHGTPDSAALALEKGAKLVEPKYPEIALELYKKAAEVVMIEDRPRQAAEYMSKGARIATKLRRYDEAADLLQKQMEYYLSGDDTKAAGRLVIAQVLIHLIREDFVAADKVFRDGYSYMEREECNTMSILLEGYDQGDAEQMNRALGHPFIKHMDVEYAKLARTLQSTAECGTGLGTYPSTSGAAAVREGAPSSNQNDEDDEYAEGLL